MPLHGSVGRVAKRCRGVAASISLNWVVTTNTASIGSGAHVCAGTVSLAGVCTPGSGHVLVSAENLLMIQSDALAETYREYISGLAKKFSEQPQEPVLAAATAPPSPST